MWKTEKKPVFFHSSISIKAWKFNDTHVGFIHFFEQDSEDSIFLKNVIVNKELNEIGTDSWELIRYIPVITGCHQNPWKRQNSSWIT